MPTPQKSNRNMAKTYGESGTVINSGFITTDEYNRALIGSSGILTYETMRRSDSTIHAILEMCKLPIKGITWSVVPASTDQSDIDIAKFVEDDMMDGAVDWHHLLGEALTMLDFGFSIFEKTYEAKDIDGMVRICTKEVGFRKQKSLMKWEAENGQPGITQLLQSGHAYIPKEKLMVFTNQREGDNHEGVSMLRYAYKDWYMKDTLVKVNGVNIERIGAGVPKVEFDPSVSETEKDRARDILRQFRVNEEGYLEVPKGSSIEMLDLKGSSVKDALPSIKYHDTQIALSVLGQFLMLGSSESGSRAVSSDHSKLFMQAEKALANNIRSTIQKQWIEQLCDLNYSDLPNGYPKLTYSQIEDDDVSAFATAVKDLVTAGAITVDFETEQAVRRVVQLPELPDEMKDEYDAEEDTADGEPADAPDTKVIEDTKSANKKDAALRAAKKSRQELIDILVRS